MRTNAVPLNTHTARSLLLGSLVAGGYDGMLSPRLSDPYAEPDRSKLMGTREWIRLWLHNLGLSYQAVTGDPKDVPADHTHQQGASVKQITGKC